MIRALNLLAFLPVAGRAPVYGRLLWALASDPRVPASRKALLGLAAAYVVSPVDLIPDRIPVLGALDDVAVVVLAVDLFLDGLPRSLVNEKLNELGIPAEELDADLRRIRGLVPAPLRKAMARIPDALEGVASFARQRGFDRRLRELVEGGNRRPQPVRENSMEGHPA
ncbi:MAG TPA: YkvA family protein [Candidatus Limnocylindria bacterium]|nr:YkvA family protein [Candidatus Limnocylindria bacterium]